MSSVATLQPQPLWRYFHDLNAIPRASKKETEISRFVQEFGRSLGLEVETDRAGNVLIRKPGVGSTTVALQSHLDMVHQKNADSTFNFDTDPIGMRVEGDWVKADGTTLGADNGIGVAAAMAVLAAKDLKHPPLEALFTLDEETGMTGAKALQPGWLRSRILLNLDTEDDRELTIGCAGGVDILASGDAPMVKAGPGRWLRVGVEGLTGGHSGMDIHRGRANANKLLNRLLYAFGAQVAWIDGGGLRNAIPREAFAAVLANTELPDLEPVLKSEYATTDPHLRVRIEPLEEAPEEVLDFEFQERFLRAIYAVKNGVFRLSPDVPGLVQTSNNLARVLLKDGRYSVQCLARGSVDSEKMDQARAIASSLELIGATVELKGSYPGWQPKPDSSIVRLMSGLYRELFREEPQVKACHAGLECGILGGAYPELEMISFGPNIHGAHSPDETVQVSSVHKFWTFLTATLERLAG